MTLRLIRRRHERTVREKAAQVRGSGGNAGSVSMCNGCHTAASDPQIYGNRNRGEFYRGILSGFYEAWAADHRELRVLWESFSHEAVGRVRDYQLYPGEFQSADSAVLLSSAGGAAEGEAEGGASEYSGDDGGRTELGRI